MQGSLKDMAVADLIQHNCLDGKTACLTIQNDGQEAKVYFDSGEVVHAALDEIEGEEVVFRILGWNEGSFHLAVGESKSGKTISRSWTGLLLEGARLLDESSPDSPNQLDGDIASLNGLEENFQENILKENKTMAKTKGERLADSLNEMLADSSDISGAAIVGNDGLVYSANVPQKELDEEMVGAVSAAIFGLGRRSAEQLKRGDMIRSLIQAKDGNIIVNSINDETLLVGLTANDVNLGMAFMEIRSMVETLGELM